MPYIWQREEWPAFTWDQDAIERHASLCHKGGIKLVDGLIRMPKAGKVDAVIDMMVSEAIETSEIEGEYIDRKDVRSSICNHLGLNDPPAAVSDKRSLGVASMMVSVRDRFNEPLTQERLWEWQSMIISKDMTNAMTQTGCWRTSRNPMLIVSGDPGREMIHYEAPPAGMVPKEMDRFIEWFNGSRGMNDMIRAGLAHVYFESIHPFADGNGRVGRAISYIALSQGLGHPAPLSLSRSLNMRKREYYANLKKMQHGDLNITDWLLWFADAVLCAQKRAKQQTHWVLFKTQLLDKCGHMFNHRQEKVISRMFQEGVEGFKGGLSVRKYEKIAKCDPGTAENDIRELYMMGALKELKMLGRRRRYDLNLGGGKDRGESRTDDNRISAFSPKKKTDPAAPGSAK